MKTLLTFVLAACAATLSVPAAAQFAKAEDAIKYRQSAKTVLACLLFLPISAHEYHSTTYLHDTRLAGGGTTQRPDRWHHTRCASANLRLATHLPLCVG